jgi:hypothetical protein
VRGTRRRFYNKRHTVVSNITLARKN